MERREVCLYRKTESVDLDGKIVSVLCMVYGKTGNVFVWNDRKCVCMERQEVCLYGKQKVCFYGTAGSVFVWKGRICVCLEMQEVCVCIERQKVCLYRIFV